MKIIERFGSRFPTGGIFTLFAGLYTAQAITVSIAQQALPVILRDSGVGLDVIGSLQLVFLPWTLKFLWAPCLDRRGIGRLGHRRGWLLLCHGGLLLCLLVASVLSPLTCTVALVAVLVLMAAVGATQDVAADALAIETVPVRQRVLVGSARVSGRNLGYVLGLGLCLPVYAAFGWTPAILLLAGLVALMGIPVWCAPAREAQPAASPAGGWSVLHGLRRPQLWLAFGFLALYQPGSRMGGALLGPFLIDQGLSISTVGWLKGAGGAAVSVVAALAAPTLVRRFGVARTLAGAALLNAAAFVLLALAARHRLGEPVVMLLVLLQASVLPVMLATIHAVMMSWCMPGRSGADSALFQSFNALLTILGSVAAGAMASGAGHGVNFLVAAGLLLVAAAAVPMCRGLLGTAQPAARQPVA